MSEELDRETVVRALEWVALGAAAVVGTVLYVQWVFFDLSITGRTGSVAALALVFFVLAATLEWKDGFGVLAFLAFAGFLAYLVVGYELGAGIAALLVVVGLVVLLALTFAIHERRLVMSRRTGAVAVTVVLVLLAGLVGFDLQPADIEYEVTVEDGINTNGNVQEAQEIEIGRARAINGGELRELVDYPNATACIYTGNGSDPIRRGVLFRTDSFLSRDTVPAGGTATADLTVVLEPETLGAFGDAIPVERASSCPESSSEPQIVVVVEDG